MSTTLKMPQSFKMPITALPMALDDSFTPAEALLKIMSKLNEVIEYTSGMDTRIGEIAKEITQNVITTITPRLDTMQTEINNIQSNVNSQLQTFKLGIDNELAEFKIEINDNLATLETNLKQYVDDKIRDLANQQLITANDYDTLGITAQEFDSVGMTALEYDSTSRTILERINNP